METISFGTSEGPDRFSTKDEIRVALSSFPDLLLMEDTTNKVYEVASDLGGHVLIEFEENVASTLLEKLDTMSN